MAIHAIDVIDGHGWAQQWHCDCGRVFASEAGFNRHLTVAPSIRPRRPWAFLRGA